MRIPRLTFVYDRKKKSNRTKRGLVELCIGSGKERRWYSTGVSLLPNEWDNGSVVEREDWVDLNNQLQTIKRKCAEIITQMMDEGRLDISAIPSQLKDSIVAKQTFIEYARERAEERYSKIRTGTKNHYDMFFKFMEEWRGIVYFTDVTEKNILKMDRLLEQRGLMESSRYNYHRFLKTFIIRAVEDGLLKRNPYTHLDIKKKTGDGIRRYLTPTEFHRLEDCVMPTERLRRVRDLFVFQTYTMLSYQDMAAFDYNKCEQIKGQTIYRACRVKTGQEFTIVLLKPALTILERYDYKLPMISNVNYNLYIKDAVKEAKIEKHVTTHWARHTGATILLNEGFPLHIIQKILGHASIRETEKTYAKLLDDTVVRTMADYQKTFKKRGVG